MIGRRHLATALLVGAVALALTTSALILIIDLRRAPQPASSADDLGRVLSDVLAPLQLLAVPATPDAGPSAPIGEPVPVRIKQQPTYWTSTGMLPRSPDATRSDILDVLATKGWTVTRQGQVTEFLGWSVTAGRGRMVLTAAVGDEATGVADTPYRRHAGWTYVQAAIAWAE